MSRIGNAAMFVSLDWTDQEMKNNIARPIPLASEDDIDALIAKIRSWKAAQHPTVQNFKQAA